MAAENWEPGKRQMGLELPTAVRRPPVSLSIWGKLFVDILTHINMFAAFRTLGEEGKAHEKQLSAAKKCASQRP